MDTLQISDEASKRISVLRFPLMFGVILVHSRTFEVGLSDFPSQIDSGIGFAAQWFVSEILARITVPLFFAISGYLFFSSRKTHSISEKWIQRSRTLLWPYLLWNSILIFIQVFGQLLPGASNAYSENALSLSDMSFTRLADLFLGFDQGLANGPLWFLRDLITLSILAPAYRIALDKTKGLFIFLPFIVWLGAFGPIFTNFPISAESVTWFGLGLAIASRGTFFSKLDLDTGSKALWLVIPYLVISAIDVLKSAGGANPFLIHKFNYFLGAAIAWSLAGIAIRIPCVSRFLTLLGPGAFFIYLAHAPVMQAIKEGTYLAIQPQTDTALFAAYLITAILTAFALSIIFLTLNRYTPRLIGVLTGRRDSQQ